MEIAMTTITLLAMTLLLETFAADLSTSRDSIDHLLAAQEISSPGYPYQAEGLMKLPVSTVRLKQIEDKKNQIIDNEAWYSRNDLAQPAGPLDPGHDMVPKDTAWGTLTFFRCVSETCVGVYATKRERPKAKGKEGWDAKIYTKIFDYTAVVFDRDHVPQKIFRLDAFYPGILAMSHAVLVGNVLFFDCNYNGYASIAKKKTGYLVALDIAEGRVLWTTKKLTASYWGFVVRDDVIVAGYGFTAEPDFLYLLDRSTGKLLQSIKLATAHETLIVSGDYLYVRTYNHDLKFRFK
jgi:hypothetical protein